MGQQPIKTKQSLPTAPMVQSTNAADILNFITLDNLKIWKLYVVCHLRLNVKQLTVNDKQLASIKPVSLFKEYFFKSTLLEI